MTKMDAKLQAELDKLIQELRSMWVLSKSMSFIIEILLYFVV